MKLSREKLRKLIIEEIEGPSNLIQWVQKDEVEEIISTLAKLSMWFNNEYTTGKSADFDYKQSATGMLHVGLSMHIEQILELIYRWMEQGIDQEEARTLGDLIQNQAKQMSEL